MDRDERLYRRLCRLPVPARLLEDLAAAPLIPEHEIGAYVEANGAGKHVGGRRESPRALWPHTGPRRLLRPSEKRVLRLLAAGLNTTQIACALGVAPQTVKNQVQHARTRLGGRNLTATVAIAIRDGFIR